MSDARPKTALARVFPHVILVPATLVTLYPVLWVVDLALRPGAELGGAVLPRPDLWSLETLRAVVSTTAPDGTPLFWRQLFNSLVVSAATTILSLSLALSAAYALSRFEFPGKGAGLRFFLVSQMFPGVVSAVPLYILLDRLGLVDTLAGLVLVYATTALPFSVFMMKGFFDQVPRELEEAATIDGASRATIFFRVVLPLVRPGLAVTTLFSFLTAWNEFILAATFLNKETSYTLPIVLKQHAGAYAARWDLFAAGALLVSIPVVALFYALQRHLVAGLTQGAVKG